MFLILSTGRCGTVAVCRALDTCSDHDVAHEPEPLLLEEGWRKHNGLPYRTETLEARLSFFHDHQHERYGEAFRSSPLAADIAEAAPLARMLILVRDPAEYVRSAHYMQVLAKPDSPWDRFRVMPHDDDPTRSHAERIAGHWAVVNDYLLAFAEKTSSPVLVGIHGPLDDRIDQWAHFAGVSITDTAALGQVLAARPNSSKRSELPAGYDADSIRALVAPTWQRALQLADSGA
jgi:hypothetical protein